MTVNLSLIVDDIWGIEEPFHGGVVLFVVLGREECCERVQKLGQG